MKSGGSGAVLSILLLTLSLPIYASTSGDDELEQKVKAGVRSLLTAIKDHNIPEILSFVGPGGVVDADQIVSRDEVVAMLRDSDSYLSRSLFKEPTPVEIKTCVEKLKGKLYVSPAAFLHAYGDDYTIQVGPIEEFEGQHYGVKVESGGEATPGCQYELFWLRMQIVDGRALLASNFFQ